MYIYIIIEIVYFDVINIITNIALFVIKGGKKEEKREHFMIPKEYYLYLFIYLFVCL